MFFINYFQLFIKTLIIRIIDFPSRIYDLIRPSFYLKKIRIKRIFYNKKSYSRRIVIFVIYQKKSIPFYIKNLLETLAKFDIAIHVVANSDIKKESLEYLNKYSNKLILRENIGRDFGAYKDEITSLDMSSYDYLYLINDSIFFFKKNLEDLLSLTLNYIGDWICLHENFEYHYHAQSFFVGFGPNIIHSDIFNRFWKNYSPYTSRLHSINMGEAKLSKVLIKTGFAPHVINSIYTLRNFLGLLTVKDFLNLIDSMWIRFGNPNYIRLIDKLFAHLESAYSSNEIPLRLNPVIEQKIIDKYSVALLAEAVEVSNSTYSGSMLFALCFGRNVFKRDIFFRDAVSISQFEECLHCLGIDKREVDYCIYELRAKGNSVNLNIWEKIKHGVGLF